MNNVTLIGNLCRDFEFRKSANSDNCFATNSIAVKRDRKEPDGTYASDFFDIICFNANAEFATKYLRKGDKVGITGSIYVKEYTTKTGAKGRAIEVRINSIENLTPPKTEVEENNSVVENEAAKALDDLPDDDLPF